MRQNGRPGQRCIACCARPPHCFTTAEVIVQRDCPIAAIDVDFCVVGKPFELCPAIWPKDVARVWTLDLNRSQHAPGTSAGVFVMSAVPSSSVVIDDLRRQLQRVQVQRADRTIVSSGYRGLDKLLPERGLPTGSVVEWVSDVAGLRAATVALSCAAEFLKQPGALAVVDPLHSFHPQALAAPGISLSRLLLVRPGTPSASDCMSEAALSHTERADALWTLEQLARCAGVRIVLAWADRLSPTAQRRLQLAVENSGVTVFLIRPAAALRQTSWADLRFHVQWNGRSKDGHCQAAASTAFSTPIALELVRSRNAMQHRGRVWLSCDHETGVVSETSELANSATAAASAS